MDGGSLKACGVDFTRAAFSCKECKRTSDIPAAMRNLRTIIGIVCLLAVLCPPPATRSAPTPLRLYFVVRSDKWGYIDETGRVCIAPQFDNANNFSDERALVSVGGKPRYIDTGGRFINTPPFDVG